MTRVTLQTIADQVGVSRMTVSNAFSRPDQLSAELRDRILSAAAALGYVGPDPAARALARGTAGAVGVLLTDSLRYAFSDEVAALFLGAIADQLGSTGLALTLLTSSGRPDMIPARDVAIDGAVVYSCDPDSDAVAWLKRRKLPMVFVDQVPEKGWASINVDDRSGTRAAAQHLVDLGHQRISIVTCSHSGEHGLVSDPITASKHGHVQHERMLGWLSVLDAAGITPTVIQSRHNDENAGYTSGRALLDTDQPPTGILCFSDAIANGVVHGAQSLGLDVPRDVSVVGFDDNPLAQRMRPALTTIRQDVTAKGQAAATALVAAIERSRRGAAGRPRHVLLPTELVVRESTAQAPKRRRR
jgi:DNA-binding LacI/PurR family transcriptional regulator